MTSLIIASMVLIVGFILLASGSNYLIDSGVLLAKKMGVPALLIGMTIIAFGTSIPETFIAFTAVIYNKPLLTIGNIIGANIANIGLILGIVSFFKPLKIHSDILKKELPLSFLVVALLGIMLFKHQMTPLDGTLLLFAAIVVLTWFIRQGTKKEKPAETLTEEYKEEITDREIKKTTSYTKAILQLLLGIILLPLGAELVVKSAIYMAVFFNVSRLVIGLTIVAIGTTLPEFAASIAGARKNQDDMVIGNILGSNIFNTLIVLAIPILVHSVTLSKLIFYRDFLTLLLMNILLYVFAFVSLKGRGKLNRFEGFILFTTYCIYFACVYLINNF